MTPTEDLIAKKLQELLGNKVTGEVLPARHYLWPVWEGLGKRLGVHPTIVKHVHEKVYGSE